MGRSMDTLRLQQTAALPGSHGILVDLMWDSTKFTLRLENSAPSTRELVASHGCIFWLDAENAQRRHELFFTPRVAVDGTAQTLYTCSSNRMCAQAPIRSLMESAPKSCMILGPDSVRANRKCSNAIFETDLPQDGLGLFLGCFQHQVGLFIEPITKSLALVCPLFCAVKQLHNGGIMDKLEHEVRAIFDSSQMRLKPSGAHAHNS